MFRLEIIFLLEGHVLKSMPHELFLHGMGHPTIPLKKNGVGLFYLNAIYTHRKGM
jgi:hypothetical protein